MREKKGITLIALVVCVLVLLILAGVSIAMLTGENGLITQTNNAKQTNEYATVKDLIMLKLEENAFEKYKGNIQPPIMYLYSEGYVDENYKVNMEKLEGYNLTLGYGNIEDGDYYSLENEKLSYINSNKETVVIEELSSIGSLQDTELYFNAVANEEIILNEEKTGNITLTLDNFIGDKITQNDILYEIELEDASFWNVEIEGINLNNEKYIGTLKGKEKVTQNLNAIVTLKENTNISNENLTFNINIKQPEEIQKTVTVNIINNIVEDKSRNNYDAKLLNGAKIEKDEDGRSYIYFDGIDDYLELPIINGNLGWEEGFIVEADIETEESTNQVMTILNLGNTENTDYIRLQILNDKKAAKFSVECSKISGDRECSSISLDNSILPNQKNTIEAELSVTNSFFIMNRHSANIKINGNNSNSSTTTVDGLFASVPNDERKENYIGKSSSGEFFKGKLYRLKISTKEGDTIIEYDLNK